MTRPSGSSPAGSAYVCSQSEVILEWLYCRTIEWLLPQTAAFPTSGGGEKGNDDSGNALGRGRIRSSEEGQMCPACIASAVVIVGGAGSTGGILAVCIGKFRKFFGANRLGPFHQSKEK